MRTGEVGGVQGVDEAGCFSTTTGILFRDTLGEEPYFGLFTSGVKCLLVVVEANHALPAPYPFDRPHHPHRGLFAITPPLDN